MRIDETLIDKKFLKLKKVIDPQNNVNGYLYAERLGVDSVAFLCYDARTKEILVNKEFKPPIGQFVIGAFGGSIDKAKSLPKIVIDETKEEAGFSVSEDDVHYVGKSFVSTQMNQWCHLFLVEVDSSKQEEREPENAIEAMAETVWVDVSEVASLEDWKAIAIVEKAKRKKVMS